MSLEDQLTTDLKEAMRRKDADVVACIRQIRSKVQEAKTAKGFSGEIDDELYRSVIRAYVKSLRKAIEEFAAAGERAQELRTRYEAELSYLDKYMPRQLGEHETRDLVRKTIEELGVTDPKQSGRVMGAIMKAHKGQVDASLARRLVDEVLAS